MYTYIWDQMSPIVPPDLTIDYIYIYIYICKYRHIGMWSNAITTKNRALWLCVTGVCGTWHYCKSSCYCSIMFVSVLIPLTSTFANASMTLCRGECPLTVKSFKYGFWCRTIKFLYLDWVALVVIPENKYIYQTSLNKPLIH